jgi:hypothetical protein
MICSTERVQGRTVAPTLGTLMAGLALLLAACGDPTGSHPTVDRVAVSPATDTVYVGSSRTLVARAYSSGATVTATFTWTSLAPSVASVDGGGTVTGHAPGTVGIVAREARSGRADTATIVVAHTPVPGTVQMELVTEATDVGAILFALVPPDGVAVGGSGPGPGVRVLQEVPVGAPLFVGAFGDLQGGASLGHMHVGDLHRVAEFGVVVIEVAGTDYALRDPAGYSVRLVSAMATDAPMP